jgi:Hemerythrin HHE cation binding domain
VVALGTVMVGKLHLSLSMETGENKLPREEKPAQDERRELLEHLAAFDRALERMDCCGEPRANLAAAHDIGYHCARLEDDLARRLAFREQVEPALASPFSPQMAEFVRQLRSDHEELRHWLARFARALEGFARARDPFGAVCRIKEEGQQLARQMARHVALEESELAGFL